MKLKENGNLLRQQLGLKAKGKTTQLDLYSNQFKLLINNLNEHKIYGDVNEKTNLITNSPKANEMQSLDQLTDFKAKVQKATNLDSEQKDVLKYRILNESRTFYENNLNIFSNGMSLMSVSALEMNQIAHQNKIHATERNNLINEIHEDTVEIQSKVSAIKKKLRKRIERLG